LTYKKTLSISPTFKTRLRYATTTSKRCVLEILQTCFLSVGALPTALKCTATLGLGKSPAVESAVAASRGREVRIMDEARVSGMSGSWSAESGIALLLVLSAGVLDREGDGDGDDIFVAWWLDVE